MKQLWICLLIFIALSAEASGIQATPSRLELTAWPRQEITASLRVGNPSLEAQIFEVYPDAFRERIAVEPASFILESRQEQKIQIRVQTDDKPAVWQTNLSVATRSPLAAAVQADVGVKIPLTIKVADDPGKTETSWVNTLSYLGRVLSFLVLLVLSGFFIHNFVVKRGLS